MIINRLKLLYTIMQQQTFANRQECLEGLQGLGIKYVLHEHEAVNNMEELSKIKLEKSPYIKNLLFADKKPNSYYMIIAESSTGIQKGFWKSVGTTHNNVRLAKEENVENILKAKRGSVNVFSLVNDVNKEVKKLFIDEKLYTYSSWAFHPMDNTATVEVEREDVIKFLDHFKIAYEKVDLTKELEAKEPAK